VSLDDATRLLRDATRLVVLTGAGVSTESGVPDFRGNGGIWTKFDPSDFQYDRFLRDPRGFWELRARLMQALDLANVRPNPAHDALARASRSPRVVGHVTQNIDGLFHVAGHEPGKLVEVHGSARSVRCIGCSAFFPYEVARAAVERGELPPQCPDCRGALKPGTILFGETLHAPDLRRAQEWFERADAVLVVGSSLVVQPVSGLPALALARGARLVIVNRDTTPYDDEADAVVRASAGEAVPAMLRAAGLAGEGG